MPPKTLNSERSDERTGPIDRPLRHEQRGRDERNDAVEHLPRRQRQQVVAAFTGILLKMITLTPQDAPAASASTLL